MTAAPAGGSEGCVDRIDIYYFHPFGYEVCIVTDPFQRGFQRNHRKPSLGSQRTHRTPGGGRGTPLSGSWRPRPLLAREGQTRGTRVVRSPGCGSLYLKFSFGVNGK